MLRREKFSKKTLSSDQIRWSSLDPVVLRWSGENWTVPVRVRPGCVTGSVLLPGGFSPPGEILQPSPSSDFAGCATAEQEESSILVV